MKQCSKKLLSLLNQRKVKNRPLSNLLNALKALYVKIVLIIVLLMLFVPHYTFGWDWSTTFYRAMVLLVVASPCALVASVMPATLAAISNGARNGILFKGGIHLEHIGNIKLLAVDKTGTLTEGTPVVTDFIVREDVTTEDALAVLATIEGQSTHPLAQAISRYANEQEIPLLKDVSIKDIPGTELRECQQY